MSSDLWILAGYLAIQFAFGFVVARRIKTEADYVLGGRRLGPFVATFTIFATWFGAETCVGAAGRTYLDGLSGGSSDPFGYAGCMLFMGVAFAGPLWRRGLTTLPDLFRERFSKGVERAGVLLMVPTSILWAAAQVLAFSHVLTEVSDLQRTEAVIAATCVVIGYTSLGGFLADAYTDVLQGIVLVFGLVAVGVFAWIEHPDPKAAFAAVPAERWSLFAPAGTTFFGNLEAWALPIIGSVVAQELIARVLACRSPSVARRSVFAATGLYVAIGLIPVALGLIGPSLVPGLDESSAETIVPKLAERHLPHAIYVVFLGGLVSAILSTVDSALLVASTMLSHNVVIPLLPRLSERGRVAVTRSGVVLCGLVAFLLARDAGTVHELVEAASGFGSAGLFVVMIAGLWIRRGRSPSAYAALSAGALTWLAGTVASGIVADFGIVIEHPFLTSLGAAVLGYVVLLPFGRPVAGAAAGAGVGVPG